jgi:hypothetical protein
MCCGVLLRGEGGVDGGHLVRGVVADVECRGIGAGLGDGRVGGVEGDSSTGAQASREGD